MQSYCECETPALVAASIVCIRASIEIDIRLHISVSDADICPTLAKFLKVLNVCNAEVNVEGDCAHANVFVWPSKETNQPRVYRQSVDGCVSIHSRVPVGKLVSFENPWDHSVTGREKLQRALFQLAPLSESTRRRVTCARVFGPEIAAHVFVHSGAIISVDPRSVVTYADGTCKFVSSLTPSRNASECVLQGSNRENQLNREVVETIKTMGMTRARNETSSSQCVSLFTCGRHAISEGEFESFGLNDSVWSVQCPLCDTTGYKTVKTCFDKAPFESFVVIVVFVPMKLIADALEAYVATTRVKVVSSLSDIANVQTSFDAIVILDAKDKVRDTWKTVYSTNPLCTMASNVYLYAV